MMDEVQDRYVKNQGYVDTVKDRWITIFHELSFMGYGKSKAYEAFDARFGEDHWLPAHSFDGNTVSRFEGYLHYDEAYYQFLKNNPEVREWIVSTASEVFDFDESNIQSGLDYTAQEAGATHLQDIAVRRALTRLQLEDEGRSYELEALPTIPIFSGDHPVQIRAHQTEGFPLNPGQVPDHEPEVALGDYKKSWWKEGSVEDIYQRNKVLLVDPDSFEAVLALVQGDKMYFENDRSHVYIAETNGRLPLELQFIRGKEARGLIPPGREDRPTGIKNSPRMDYGSWQKEFPHLKLPYMGKKGHIDYGVIQDG